MSTIEHQFYLIRISKPCAETGSEACQVMIQHAQSGERHVFTTLSDAFAYVEIVTREQGEDHGKLPG